MAVWPPGFSPRLVIFDKDGTLIDFNYMWATWVLDLGNRLDSATARPVSPSLFRLFGFDPVASHVDPGGPLAVRSMADLHQLLLDSLYESGLDPLTADKAIALAWRPPDPVALARPLANLLRVFRGLKSAGAKIAVATSDDREATLTTLQGLGIGQYVDALAGADDDLPIKPAPDVVLYLCRRLDVNPRQAAVVGDAVADLQMGRAAGAGFVVGVLSGVGSREDLTPYADVLITSVDDLI